MCSDKIMFDFFPHWKNKVLCMYGISAYRPWWHIDFLGNNQDRETYCEYSFSFSHPVWFMFHSYNAFVIFNVMKNWKFTSLLTERVQSFSKKFQHQFSVIRSPKNCGLGDAFVIWRLSLQSTWIANPKNGFDKLLGWNSAELSGSYYRRKYFAFKHLSKESKNVTGLAENEREYRQIIVRLWKSLFSVWCHS